MFFGQKPTNSKNNPLYFDSWSKIGHDFSNKVVQKLKLSKYNVNKKCAPKLHSIFH